MPHPRLRSPDEETKAHCGGSLLFSFFLFLLFLLLSFSFSHFLFFLEETEESENPDQGSDEQERNQDQDQDQDRSNFNLCSNFNFNFNFSFNFNFNFNFNSSREDDEGYPRDPALRAVQDDVEPGSSWSPEHRAGSGPPTPAWPWQPASPPRSATIASAPIGALTHPSSLERRGANTGPWSRET